MKKKALVIVAHPDDETIWMGGAILTMPNMDWTILSLCRASDKDRAPKFKKVCKYLGAKGIILDLEDEGIMGVKESVPIIKEMVSGQFAGKKFDFIFTHGYNGEYGHDRHKGTHLAVKDLVKNKILFADKLIFFAFKSKLSSFSVELNGRQFNEKKNIIKNLYGFSEKTPEASSYCLPKENFYESSSLS